MKNQRHAPTPTFAIFLAIATACSSCAKEEEVYDTLAATTSCSPSESPDPALEGTWNKEAVVCFDESLEDILVLADYSEVEISIDVRGSCATLLIRDSYCGALIGSRLSVPEELVVTVSDSEVLTITDGTSWCWFYDYLDGVYPYIGSEYDLDSYWLDVEYTLGETIPEYSHLYILAEDGNSVLLDNNAFTPSAGGYCFTEYLKDGATDEATRTASRASARSKARKQVAMRKLQQELRGVK